MSEQPGWDDEFASRLIGATILIGLTYVRPEGHERVQRWGVITSANATEGFEVTLSGVHEGEDFWLPPDTGAFEEARPGVYTLKETGESVTDPEFIATWTINPPAS